MVKKVYLNGTIGIDITNSQIVESLKNTNIGDTVIYMVNSGGGSVLEAIAMYNTLQSAMAKTVFRIVALAGSAMTYVMLAAKKIEMAKNAKLLIHSVEGFPSGRGTADNLESTAEIVRKFDADLIAGYAAKTGKDEKYITKNYVNGADLEVWLTAEQALSEGFIDEVVNSFTEIPTTAYTNIEFLNAIIDTKINDNKMETEDLKRENETLKASLQKSFEALAQSKGLVGANLQMVLLASQADYNKALELLASIEHPKEPEQPKENTPVAAVTPELVSIADLAKAFQNTAKEDERSTWNIYDWQANAPQDLIVMMDKEPNRYDAIVAKTNKFFNKN